MSQKFSQVVKVRRLPPGRTGYAARRVLLLAAALPAGRRRREIERIAAALIQQARKARMLRNLLAAVTRNHAGTRTAGSDRREVDNDADRLIGSFHQQVHRYTLNFDANHPQGRRARRFLEVAFAADLQSIIHVPYLEQLMQMELMLENIQTHITDDDLKELGLVDYMARFEELVETYRAALDRKDDKPLTAAEVRAAENRSHEQLCQLIVTIMGQFNDLDDPADIEARDTLLAPIYEQDAVVAELNRRRSKVVDIDPATGEEDLTTDDAPVSA